MDLLDPTDFDVVVLGSGLPESLIASAAAKGGKRVLLLDPEETYGGSWTTTNFTQFLASLKAKTSLYDAAGVTKSEIHDGELGICDTPVCRRKVTHMFDPKEQQLPHGREYLVDACPKVLFQGEPLVDLLVRSKVHNYMDFRSLDESVIAHNGCLSAVPATKSDIFKAKQLSLNDKRHLMQFLNRCFAAIDSNTNIEGFHEDDFLVKALDQAQLSQYLKEAIMYGIALADQHGSELTVAAGQKALQLYMESYSKFGTASAFMMPMYGAGAVAEGFIRAAAVHSAVTVLRHPVTCLSVSQEQAQGAGRVCTGLHTAYGQHVTCHTLVANANYLRPHIKQMRSVRVSRALLLTDKSLLPPSECVSVLCPPASVAENAVSVRLLQVGYGLAVTPKNKFMVYCSAISSGDGPLEQLKPVVDELFNTQHLERADMTEQQEPTGTYSSVDKREGLDRAAEKGPATASEDGAARLDAPNASTSASASSSKPRVLHAIFYEQEMISQVDCSDLPRNIVCCPSGDSSLVGYSEVLAETEQLFRQHFPDVAWWADVEMEQLPDEEEEEDVLDDLRSAVASLGTSEAGS